MGAIGLVCEYNPFHLGHLYHLEKSRELAGEGPVVCVLSGEFVQRGEAAVYSKFARAEAACLCGADLVVELPPPWALASAEGFAFGAVSLLGRLGADRVSFGSECGDIRRLSRVAEILSGEDFPQEIRALLKEDPRLSYAAARQAAAENRLGADGSLLAWPNNILGVEYLKAIRRLGLKMEAVTVARKGSGHDQAGADGGVLSAWELRRRLADRESLRGLLPAAAEGVFDRERDRGREMAQRDLLEAALLSRLRLLDRAAFEELPDAGNGLGGRIWQAVREEPTLEAVCRRAATRRYPLARVRRVCLCACLGIREGMSRAEPPYARVLAANCRGRELLRRQKESGRLPVLTKPASVRALPADCQALFELTAAAHDLYVLGYPAPEERRGGEDWRRGPFIADGPLAGTCQIW